LPGVKLNRSLRVFLVSIFRNERVPLERLSYVFCTDDYLLSLNQQYLFHDTLTDILTFTLSEPRQPVEGEIYISVDRVRENAIKFKNEYDRELLRVIIHGILHLCGYNDHTSAEKTKMRKKEDLYLENGGFT
jgi:probable rRNA maturation factor